MNPQDVFCPTCLAKPGQYCRSISPLNSGRGARVVQGQPCLPHISRRLASSELRIVKEIPMKPKDTLERITAAKVTGCSMCGIDILPGEPVDVLTRYRESIAIPGVYSTDVDRHHPSCMDERLRDLNRAKECELDVGPERADKCIDAKTELEEHPEADPPVEGPLQPADEDPPIHED